jgi:hypothetical protein
MAIKTYEVCKIYDIRTRTWLKFSGTLCDTTERVAMCRFVAASTGIWLHVYVYCLVCIVCFHPKCAPPHVQVLVVVYIYRVGQNHIYTVHIRCFRQGNYQIYGHIRCIYTVLANPIYIYKKIYIYINLMVFPTIRFKIMCRSSWYIFK